MLCPFNPGRSRWCWSYSGPSIRLRMSQCDRWHFRDCLGTERSSALGMFLGKMKLREIRQKQKHWRVRNWNWAVLSDERMTNGWPFSLVNDEQRVATRWGWFARKNHKNRGQFFLQSKILDSRSTALTRFPTDLRVFPTYPWMVALFGIFQRFAPSGFWGVHPPSAHSNA